jgi:hypothetical protein
VVSQAATRRHQHDDSRAQRVSTVDATAALEAELARARAAANASWDAVRTTSPVAGRTRLAAPQGVGRAAQKPRGNHSLASGHSAPAVVSVSLSAAKPSGSSSYATIHTKKQTPTRAAPSQRHP